MITDPTEFTVDVALFFKLGVGRHSCPLDFIFLIWIKLAFGRHKWLVHFSELLVKVRLEVL